MIKLTWRELHNYGLWPTDWEPWSASCSPPHTWQLDQSTCSVYLIPENLSPPGDQSLPCKSSLIYYHWQTSITLHYTAGNKLLICGFPQSPDYLYHASAQINFLSHQIDIFHLILSQPLPLTVHTVILDSSFCPPKFVLPSNTSPYYCTLTMC